MNERIKELAEQAGFELGDQYTILPFKKLELLIRQDEREACANLCDENERANLYGVKECAAAIRARSNND